MLLLKRGDIEKGGIKSPLKFKDQKEETIRRYDDANNDENVSIEGMEKDDEDEYEPIKKDNMK